MHDDDVEFRCFGYVLTFIYFKLLFYLFICSRPYWRSRYWYSVASVVCDVMYCG